MGVALVTGASAGFGVEFAKLFARDGYSVILVARREDRLKQLAVELKALNAKISVWTMAMDLSATGAGKSLFAQVQALNLSVDFLINNAGFGSGGEFTQLPLKDELQMIDLNVRTLVELTHIFLAPMRARNFGRILNVGSTAGFQPGPFMATYYASKAFVNSFSEALHEELRGTGVTCTLLAPGATATEFAQVAKADKSRLFKMMPMRPATAVVRLGYDGMMNGRAICIPGVLNRIGVQSLRLSPRAAVRRLIARLNRS
jgi:short-subunit dehydrogenase